MNIPHHETMRENAIARLHARLDHSPLKRDSFGQLDYDAEGRTKKSLMRPFLRQQRIEDGAPQIVGEYLRELAEHNLHLKLKLQGMSAGGPALFAMRPGEMRKFFPDIPPGRSVDPSASFEGFTDFNDSPGDVPSIVAESIGRAIGDNYVRARRVWMSFARPGTLPRMEPGERARFADFGTMTETPLETKYSNIVQTAAESIQLRRYLQGLTVTRRMVADDDLDVIASAIRAIPEAAVRTEDELAFRVLVDNAALADGTPLFDATRNNTAASPTSIAAGMELLATQTDRRGTPLDHQAAVVLTPASLRLDVEGALGDVRPLTDRPRVVASGWLDHLQAANGVERFAYIATDPEQHAALEVATLSTQPEPQVRQRVCFDTDGVQVRVSHFAGAAAVDPQAIVRVQLV